MNIAVQICGLMNILVLLVFYSGAKQLDLYKRRVFFYILLISVANLCLDIGSVIAIHYQDTLPSWLVMVICRLYLCMLDLEGIAAIVYTIADVFSKQIHRIITGAFAIICMAECVAVFFYPLHIFSSGREVYTYGPAVNLMYIFSAVNISIIWISSFAFGEKVRLRRKQAVRLWMVIWLLGMGVQAFDHSLLVIGFATSLGIMVVFFMLENPEGFIDSQYDCLNNVALSEYVDELIQNDEFFVLCSINLDNASHRQRNNEKEEKRIAKYIEYFDRMRKASVFKTPDNSIVLVSDNTPDMKSLMEDFLDEFSSPVSGSQDHCIIWVENSYNLSSFVEIKKLVRFFRNKRRVDEKQFIHVTREMVEDYQSQDKIKKEIKSALKEDRVEVFLQPIYNTEKKRYTSAEALVRIRNTDGSLMPPGLFVPVAEATGQINALGRRVLEKTCDFLANTEATALGIEYIEVNLSVVQAEKMSLFDEIMNTVRYYKVSPRLINLEITESALIHSKDVIINNMNQLKKVGFTFALDDFGKGESNLMYLVEMPFDILKLDMDMTKAFHVNRKAKSAVKTVRYMAKEMNLKIVAEGIENRDELFAFLKYDIEYIQGYYFSKPLPMPEFIDFVKNFNEVHNISPGFGE